MKKKMIMIFVMLLIFSVIGNGFGIFVTAKAEEINIGISHNATIDSPWEKASKAFAEIVNEKEDSQMKVKTYPNGALVQKNWKIMLEMVQVGAVEMGIEGAVAIGSVIPEVAAFNLPFVFNDDDHITRFLNNDSEFMNMLKEEFRKKDLELIAISPRPFRQLINNVRLVKTSEDIKGLKFRVPDNPLFVNVFKAMGANPVPLPSSEIYSAIQLGIVVGEDNAVPIVYDQKTYEVAKNMTLWNYMGDTTMLLMNKDLWDSLDDKQKEIINKAGKEFAKVDINEMAEYSVEAKNNMEDAGVKFYNMSEEEKKPFKEKMEPIYEDYKNQIGEERWNMFVNAVEEAK